MTDLMCALIISIIFFLIFVAAEIWHKNGADIEVTRKFVHFVGAFFAIFFPFIFSSHIAVLILACVFAFTMIITRKTGMLQSVHGVSRKSEGAVYYPIAVYICFLYAQILNQPWFYVISILILAVSDALAALVGKNYGANEFVVEIGTRKTVEGSVTFFLATFLITHLILLLATSTGRAESVLVALLISIIVTVFEGVSLKGADNLFIPLATMFILSKNIHPTLEGVTIHLFALGAFLGGYLLVMLPYKRIGFSGVTLIGLINYIIWALLGNIYAVILFVFAFLCQKTNLILHYDCNVADAYRVKPVFYIMTVPVICAFAGNYLGEHAIYPFAVSFVVEGFLIRTNYFNWNFNKGLWVTAIISLIALGVSYVFIR